MAAELSFGELEPLAEGGDKAPEPASPLRVAILGNFSGREETRDRESLKQVKPRRIDGETFEDEMTRFNVKVEFDLPNDETASLSFPTLDEFDPDEVYREVDQFDDCDTKDEKCALMNAVLHHPKIRQIESLWRGLDWLIKRMLKSGSRIEFLVYDLSFDELAADVGETDQLSETALYQLLIDDAMLGPKGEPWGLLLGAFTFDTSKEHIELLGRVAKIARQAAVPFLADADGRLLSKDNHPDEDTLELWEQLRKLPEANLIGLALPRFLIRPPYGENTRSIEKFDYEEFTGPDDDCYLLAPSVFACAGLVAAAFHKDGWACQPGSVLNLGNMPMHVWRDDDDDEHMTVTEKWLHKDDVARLNGIGLMPFLPIKKQDAIQLLRFQSLAVAPEGQEFCPLLGRWGHKDAVRLPRSGQPELSASVGMGGPAGSTTSSVPPPASDAGGDDDTAAAGGGDDDEDEMDPELAALMGDMDDDDAGGGDDDDEMDPELAALMAGMDDEAGDGGDDDNEMDPELAALMADMDGGDDDAGGGDEEMDPELAALMADIDGGDDSASEDGGGDDDMDPELAALLGDIEGDGGESESSDDGDDMDPELAALLGDVESDDGGSESSAPESDDMDPELAALLGDIESDDAPDSEDAVSEPTDATSDDTGDDEMDPELAALLGDIEADEESSDDDSADSTEDEMDPELAALLGDIEGDESTDAPDEETEAEDKSSDDEAMDPELAALLDETSDEEQASDPDDSSSDESEEGGDNELSQKINELGGRRALADLGWPVDNRAFASDHSRQLAILEGFRKNPAVQKEVDSLVAMHGGYDNLVEHGVSQEQPIGEQLVALQKLRDARDLERVADDPDLSAMAKVYGVSLDGAADDSSRLQLLRQMQEFDKWVHDPRHLDTLSALEGLSFEQKRQVQLAQQFHNLGGEAAWQEWTTDHPTDAQGEELEVKVALLLKLREYNRLGGEGEFEKHVEGDQANNAPLTDKVALLKALVNSG